MKIKHKYVHKDIYTRKDYKVDFVMNLNKHNLLKRKCEENGITVSDFIRTHIDSYIKDLIPIVKEDNFYTIDGQVEVEEEKE